MTPPPEKDQERCPTCGLKWPIVVVAYATRFPEPHCAGCMRPVARCTCSR